MKINEFKGVLKENFLAQKFPIFAHGSPGIGKTEAVEQVVEELRSELGKPNLILKTIILSQYESVDLRGIPSVESGISVWNPPEDLLFPPDAEGIIFFDELPNAAQDVQKAAQQYIHTGKLGRLTKPEGMMIVACGNRQQDKAGANKVLTALANRFEHHDLSVDFSTWKLWALANGIEHEVIAFLGWKENYLNDFDPNRNENATPRSWAKVSSLLRSSFYEDRVIGNVGKGIGAEFIAYRKIWNKVPNLEMIWKNPDKVEMPKEMDIVYATVGALSLKATPKNFPNSLAFLKKTGLDMQVLFLKNAAHTNPNIRKCEEWKEFLKQNKVTMFD